MAKADNNFIFCLLDIWIFVNNFFMKKIVSDIIFDQLKLKTESENDLAVTSTNLGEFLLEEYEVKNFEEAKLYKKQLGKYKLLSIPSPLELSKKSIAKAVDIFAGVLQSLVGEIKLKDRILVVGLGNRHISADSLGTQVIKNINITFGGNYPKVMAICPSVLGLTGIETYDIVSGIIDRVKPTIIIFVDSLCASSSSRLGKSIQVTNTGICPGSGIGNRRKCLSGDLANKVVSIGVPLLIYASTFVSESLYQKGIDLQRINSTMQSAKNLANVEKFTTLLKDLKDVLNTDLEEIVTLKDIEECTRILSDIISKAINKSLGVDALN